MQSTGNKQKPQQGGGKQHVSPLPTTSQSSSHLEAFFADYFPKFQYDATVSASWEFYRLCDEFGWDKEDPKRRAAHQKFKDALVQQFNDVYGTDVNDIKNWQNLCYVVRIDPIPEDLEACREAVYYTFVNLVDLVDTKTTGVEVEVFDSERALSDYTKSKGKFFPREEALAGGVLQYLLRHIYYPRDGYDSSRQWKKGKGGKGRKVKGPRGRGSQSRSRR